MKMHRAARWICTTIALAIGTVASADIVILRDGTEYRGTIVETTSRMIKIRTIMGTIPTTLTLERWRVAEYKIDETTRIDQQLEEQDDDAGSKTKKVTGASRLRKDAAKHARAKKAAFDASTYSVEKQDGRALVLEIPLEGTFGEDIYPMSIAAGLEWAVENGVTDVVFRIDSGGGQVWAAKKIVDIMNRHADDLNYHGLIQSAISASIWPMFSCDTITMVPGSDFGGAVVFVINKTGSAEVDKKMNGIWAAKLASAAEGKGHLGAVVKSMMLSESELWAFRRDGSDDAWQITAEEDEAKAAGNEHVQIDADDEVLTLTAKQAVKFGIVHGTTARSIESFATAIEIGPYDEAGDYGIDAAEYWNEQSDELRDKIESKLTSLFSYLNQSGSNRYSFAVSALNSAKKELAIIRKLLAEAEELEMDTIVEAYENYDYDTIQDQIRHRKKDLMRLRHGG